MASARTRSVLRGARRAVGAGTTRYQTLARVSQRRKHRHHPDGNGRWCAGSRIRSPNARDPRVWRGATAYAQSRALQEYSVPCCWRCVPVDRHAQYGGAWRVGAANAADMAGVRVGISGDHRRATAQWLRERMACISDPFARRFFDRCATHRRDRSARFGAGGWIGARLLCQGWRSCLSRNASNLAGPHRIEARSTAGWSAARARRGLRVHRVPARAGTSAHADRGSIRGGGATAATGCRSHGSSGRREGDIHTGSRSGACGRWYLADRAATAQNRSGAAVGNLEWCISAAERAHAVHSFFVRCAAARDLRQIERRSDTQRHQRLSFRIS